ncbi:MAG TPA: peptidase M14, partial [Pseudomonadales bacterium]|nr:peptidase M14 [Pseudomonadales bacterium]
MPATEVVMVAVRNMTGGMKPMVVQNLCLIMALLLLAFSSTAASKGASTAASTAADPEDFWPRTTYNPDVPEIADVLGYGYGMKISSPREIIRYAEALAAYDPGRVKLVEYARSWQNRPLIYLVISSKDNMDRLAETQFNMMRLSDPVGLSSDSIENLVESTLPVSWLAYGVHGDEISSSDAALLTAYHLLAAKNSPEVDQILAATIVVIDPSQNPDGR